ncbi:RNA polymerase subunit sigma-70 [Carnobacterium divergens]|uniref:RNA polymerase sigma factor n=1 Tax=Bacilli TaxID=91061 RepID=UPI0007668A44|nr:MULTISPECIES: sigma-70 family RNA polymerase sigma factor [Bacilli]EAC4976909.1 sigma-70 family RNA polymerase sigma factor [Listeria monocytogenes]EAC9100666.1 sigma-70 family RNA polymerase sigma factor [Listeria monocytogenes]EAD2089345.1 sigma-70 family RNA polymerase sigma factor [Listeria monocytogenes]EAE1383940.1 sigma-70 family RNA polymerase sigma factor [Listeria monocytogenes]EAE6660280.1 sigma-70 family RNA polymerase sigma factor [Listeria monocytogenes]
MTTTSNYEKTIEHQFDSFCKTVVRNFARDIYDENKRRNERLISLEALSMAELSQLSIFDDYDSNYIIMTSYDYDIRIEDVLIAQAIGKLTKRKQDIILLSFFLSMTNADIATLMDLAESTVHYHKTNALKELKKLMEEH